MKGKRHQSERLEKLCDIKYGKFKQREQYSVHFVHITHTYLTNTSRVCALS